MVTFYSLIFLDKNDKINMIAEKKKNTPLFELCGGLPIEFHFYLEEV
jgi:hypothetical protein